MPYWTLLTGYTVDLVAFVELSPQTKAAQPFEIAVTRLPFERDLLGELLVLDWQVALDGTGLEALLVCQPLGVWTYSGGATMTAGLKETPRLTIDDWLRRSEEQGDLGLIQRLSMQVRRPDLGRADRAEGIQEGHMKVPLSPTKSLFPFRAGSSGRTILHEFKEKPVEPTTLRQPEEKPTGHTTAPKPKKKRITGMAPPRLEKIKKNRITHTKSGGSQRSVSTRKGSPEDVPPALRVVCEAMDFGDFRRFIDDCLAGQENESGLDCPQSEEEFLGLLEVLRAKARVLSPLSDAPPRRGKPSASLAFAPSRRLLAMRAERKRLEAVLRVEERDRPGGRSLRKLRRKLESYSAEVTALEKREREAHTKRRDAVPDSRQRRSQIVKRVEGDIRRAFEFGAARPTRRLPWRLLPPGELTNERLRRHYKRLQHRNPHVRYDMERLEKAFSLEPEACYVGTDEFEGYVVFAFARTQAALLECPVYGNAIYVLGPDWRRLSKMSKQDLLSGRPGGVTKIVHRGDWFRRVKMTFGLR